MNLSETAFVSLGWTKAELLSPSKDPTIERRTLRWFTPLCEIALCGHATVASAKALFSTQLKDSEKTTIQFESKYKGVLGASLGDDGKIILNFPANPTKPITSDADHPWLSEILVNAVGPNPSEVIEDVQYSPGTKVLLIRIKDELGPETMKEGGPLKPNYEALIRIDTGEVIRNIAITVKGSEEVGKPDFYSRFVAPWEGVNEDPVCGMAHTVLTPYWTKELGNNGTLYAKQYSIRGGDLMCTLLQDRVQIAGNAKISLRGEVYF